MTELEKELLETNKQLTYQNQLLTEQVAYLTKRLFGTSSEKNSRVGDGQLSIFNEESSFLMSQSQLRNKPTTK